MRICGYHKAYLALRGVYWQMLFWVITKSYIVTKIGAKTCISSD